MGNPYPMLTFPGLHYGTPAGMLWGFDETYRPYVVIDSEMVPATDSPAGCAYCGRKTDHTHVRLQYAEMDQVKAQQEQFQIQVMNDKVRTQAAIREFMSHFGGGKYVPNGGREG